MAIRGWLLTLCLLLTVWNPAVLAFIAASTVANGAASTAALAFLALRLAVTGFGVAAGMALWHKRPGAVRLAQAALVLFATEAIARLSSHVGVSEAPPGLRLPYALSLIVFNAAWFLYLDKSRRVRATYGLESAGTHH